MCFEGGLQWGQTIGGRLALGHLFFQGFQHLGDGLVGLFTQRLALGRIHFGFGRLGFFGSFATGSTHSTHSTHSAGGLRAGRRLRLSHHFASQAANFVGPHRHLRHRQCGIGQRQRSGGQRRRETLPNSLQLALRSFQLDREFGLHHGPNRVVGQLQGLALPLRHVALQTRQTGLRF